MTTERHANMVATLDHISAGRFELGMGAGWNFTESDARQR